MAIDPTTAPISRTFWQRRVLDPVVAQLTQGITPEKIALTIAVGSALANFPLIGTMWLCLLVGIILKLNQPIIQAVNIIFAPVHLLIVIPNLFYWGNKLFGVPQPRAASMRHSAELMWNLLIHEPMTFVHRFGMLVFHATVVWAIVAPLWIAVVYYSLRTTLREVARVRAEAAKAAASKVPDPTNHPVP